MKKKVLITGSSGFIGRNLKEFLEKDFIIVAPNHKQLDLLDDEAVQLFLKKHKFDTVIHCATHNATANSKKDLTQVFKNNLHMFFNLAANNHLYKRMFYFGSGAEYDKRNYRPKMKEDYFGKHIPVDDYGFSKYISAEYIKTKPNIFDLRIFGCFGKYEDWEIRFISNALCKAMYGFDITLRQNVYFDYLSVVDLCQIVKKFILAKQLFYQYYNVCTGITIDLLTIARKIKEITGKKIKIKIAAKGLKPEYSGNNKRLMQEFPDILFTPIDVSIKQLFDWYRTQKEKIHPSMLKVDKV